MNPGINIEGPKKTKKTSVMTVCFPAEIRIEDLQYTDLKLYLYTSSLDSSD
jgi:hypothetical protein